MSAIGHIKAATAARTRNALKSLYYPCYRGFVRSWCRLLDLRERPHHGPGGRDRFPPAYLRYRVSGTPSLEVFLRVGKRSYQDLIASLEVAGKPLSSLGSVLDFGCGCGRTISWLGLDHPEKDLHGTDIDDEAVDWCRANLPLPQFRTNGQEPPLEYSAETFDLVYAISVFTHLPERYQLLWLEEFRRILRPGGVLVLTVYGQEVWERLDSEIARQVIRKGILHCSSDKLRGIHPEWYQTTFHTSEYVLREFGRRFEVLAHIPGGMGDLDAVVLGRR